MKQTNNMKKLAVLMSTSAFDGTIIALAGAGMIQLKSLLIIVFPIIAGPASILLAINLGGAFKERMLTSLLAGLISTSIVVFASVFGVKLSEFINFGIMRLFGGVVVLCVSLMLFGLKIPEKTIPIMITLGLVTSFVLR